jgi:hypothetical protein
MAREQPDPVSFGLQRNGVYIPGPIEIKKRCAEIRALWPPYERRKRIQWAVSAPVTLMTVAREDL